ncbi:hypothetical protein [Kitasatospora sp. NPDC048538]|uniref:hypothetical protein n=1 Tax=unclassified Kitasatospora TaxID=2633591 RepID=UPI0033F3AA06
MDETSTARAELDRLGRSLRGQLVALITDLTVRVHLRRLTLDEPKVADGGEPPRHHYATDYQGKRPTTSTAAGTAARATFLLRTAGWDVTESEEDDDGRLWTVLLARRDGSVIRILTSEDTLAVVFRGRTPALALCPPQPDPPQPDPPQPVQDPEPIGEPEPFRDPEPIGEPEPVRQPLPVRESEPVRGSEPVEQREPLRTQETLTPGYVLCYECDGHCRCPRCGGRGWLPGEAGRKRRCGECRTTKVCPICWGAGELAVSDLSTYQRDYYPELGGR